MLTGGDNVILDQRSLSLASNGTSRPEATYTYGGTDVYPPSARCRTGTVVIAGKGSDLRLDVVVGLVNLTSVIIVWRHNVTPGYGTVALDVWLTSLGVLAVQKSSVLPASREESSPSTPYCEHERCNPHRAIKMITTRCTHQSATPLYVISV